MTLQHVCDWIYELENKLSRATISCVNQIIEPEDLQLSISSFSNLTFKDAKDIFERDFITNALREANFRIAVAAKNMGISRPTLYDMMKRHGIVIKTEATLDE